MTQAVADKFSAGIAEHPEDWHMLQPLFVADLADDRSRARP
jgi:KDO2-lipid IV(A) lauroyltransferase